MKSTNGKQRTSEGQRYERGQPESEPRGMGAFPGTSSEYGSYEVGTSGEDSHKSNPVIAGGCTTNQISGKLVSQLIDETEKQLAYYEEQVEVLRDRLKELKQIPETLTDVDHTE
ncbi:hypothetical protein [Nostoc sp.]|uniref:hypothetical protein n=1 Tax=Nostoc sp. TaxID=1180 RepID=UPI002FFB59A8